jgi:microcystin-dependent protein
MALWQWSKTPASNATADPSINWSEGMPPSVVNDSARAMMARLAEYRDDISGSLTTGGTASAYTLTTNEGLATPTPTTGQLVSFVVNNTNALGATLTVDAGSAYPLQAPPGSSIAAGVLVSGSPYTATFSGTAWLLRNFFSNPFNIPIGGMMPYLGVNVTGGNVPNSNFALPFGQAISRTTYSVLFGLCGTLFGVGDGTTTFNIPDIRGRSIFALDNLGGGAAAGRITVAGGNFDGTVNGNSGGSQNETLTQAQLPVFSQTPTFSGTLQTWNLNQTVNSNSGVIAGGSAAGSFDHTSITPTVTITPAGTISAVTFGSGSSHPQMPPSMVLPYILRII